MRAFDLRFRLDDLLLGLYNGLARLKELRMSSELERELARNASLRNIHSGERCFIIGNGPSIKDQDLTLLRNETTFVVNRFIHHPQAEAIDPTYYCIVDPKFGTGAWGTDFIEQVERRLPRVTLFLSHDGQNLVNQRGILLQHRKFTVFPNQVYHFGYRRRIDLCRGIPGGMNVTKAAISVAVYMGFKEVCLLGIDGNGLILSENSHFYGHEDRPAKQEELEKALVSMSMGLRAWRAIVTYLGRQGISLVSMNPRTVLTAIPARPYPPAGLAPSTSGTSSASG